MKTVWMLGLFLIAINGNAQTAGIAEWTKLIDAGNAEKAKQLCTQFLESKDLRERVEAQKCLANVALSGHDVVMLQGNGSGGGTLSGGCTSEAVDEALLHLNAGIKLAPEDLTIHQGRLHVLEASGRYAEMIKALDDSCNIYKGTDALQSWLAYASELSDLEQYEPGLEFMKVLDAHYPKSPDVLGNIGAFLSMLGKPAEAIPYLQQATQLAPTDPINAWDLGRAYDRSDQIALADQWYQKGLALQTEPKQLKDGSCLYAQFVERKLNDTKRACLLERKSCDTAEQAACSQSSNKKTQLGNR
jgi:tetratricopeptide (TPR) repeat protein